MRGGALDLRVFDSVVPGSYGVKGALHRLIEYFERLVGSYL